MTRSFLPITFTTLLRLPSGDQPRDGSVRRSSRGFDSDDESHSGNRDPDQDHLLFHSGLHPVVLIIPCILLLVGIFFATQHALHYPGLILFAAGAYAVIRSLLNLYCSHFCVYTSHLEVRSGILVTEVISIPARNIETIELKQSLGGALLGYGSLFVVGTGGTVNAFHQIRHPLSCRRFLERIANEKSMR